MVIATDGAVKICIITGEEFIGFTVGPEEYEGELIDGPIKGALCGCFNVWDGLVLAFQLVFVRKRLMLVLLNKYVPAIFRGTKRQGRSRQNRISFSYFIQCMIIWSIWLICYSWIVLNLVTKRQGRSRQNRISFSYFIQCMIIWSIWLICYSWIVLKLVNIISEWITYGFTPLTSIDLWKW